MRRHTKKALQLLLAAFLLFVIYLNLNLTDLISDPRRANNALPWGDDFKRGRRPSLSFSGQRIHDHAVKAKSVHNDTTSLSISSHHSTMLVYPSVEEYSEDRIVNQLSFVSQDLVQKRERGAQVSSKKILVYNGLGSWHIPRGQTLFKEQKCTVQDCELVDDRSKMNQADVVLFQHPPGAVSDRPYHQIWALFVLESPYHTPSFASSRAVFNWTATYRHDSTIVAPYEKYVPLNASLLTRKPTKNYAAGKTKKVAWFVSNCGARNKRRQYADELGKHIQVDIYGGCGTLKCPRFQSDKCFGMLNKDYKFYLSFENSNCRDYITEKFFINGLKHDVIPIVMGAAPEDYKRAAPPHSFIHVDEFETPKDLAAYLLKLDQDDSLYNEYFAWKGLWDNINTFFWCRVCALAHDTERRGHSWFSDVETWWRGPGVCIGQDNWRTVSRVKPLIADLAFSPNEH
ncbi:hypothetical protein BaRGS_00017259 [Batillaria attramentaria]|uniref:Fucosyltransferase n=1 Tax=Batillaria attramentaria TaxID=370345 RepID=A0ABD0KWK0_9CAEN